MMQFKIINQHEGFTREDCAKWFIKSTTTPQAPLITKTISGPGRCEYFFHLPDAEPRFSISNSTLFWKSQWIGTISSGINPRTNTQENLIYFNHAHPELAFREYLETPLALPNPPTFSMGLSNPNPLKNKPKGHNKHQLQLFKNGAEKTAPSIPFTFGDSTAGTNIFKM